MNQQHRGRVVVLATLLTLSLASLVAHGGHEHSPYLELNETARHITGQATIEQQLIRAEAWYNPTPVGKRSEVTFKIFDANGLSPDLLAQAYVQSNDEATSFPLKIEADPDLPKDYCFVRALPTQEPQNFVLYTKADPDFSDPIILKGFAFGVEKTPPPPPPAPPKPVVNWWLLGVVGIALSGIVLMALYSTFRRR